MRIESCNRIQNPCTILCILGNRSDLIQGRCKCDQTITGNSAVCRFQTSHTAKCSRLTNRTAGIRAKGSRSQRCRYARRRTAGRTARYTLCVKRIACLCKCRGLCRTAHCKFIHACLAEHNHILCHQLFHNRCIIRRDKVFQHLRGTGGFNAVCTNVVFDCHRDAAKYTCISGINLFLRSICICHGTFCCYSNITLNRFIISCYPIQISLCQFRRRNFFSVQHLTQFSDSLLRKIHMFYSFARRRMPPFFYSNYSTTFGTTKQFSSFTAFCRIFSVGKLSALMSSRKSFR